MQAKKVSALYVHIPFCKNICYYCDFCKIYYKEDIVDRYLTQLNKELEKLPYGSLETIYIGGGTPSCLTIKQLNILLSSLSRFVGKNTIEYSIETNPEQMCEDKIKLFKKYGLSRISIGVQTFDEQLLKSIGRFHTRKNVADYVELLKEYEFDNISFDMMYGLPGQTISSLEEDLELLRYFDTKHVSYYSLILEDNTIFSKKNIDPIDDELELQFFEKIKKTLTDIGFINYEVSNYSKKGYQSKHNLKYWNYEDYYGVGSGAVGKNGSIFSTTSKNVFSFADGEVKVSIDKKSSSDLQFEHLMMSLRKVNGIDIIKYNKLYNVDLLDKYSSVFEKHKNKLVIENGFLKCSELGLNFLHEILIDML